MYRMKESEVVKGKRIDFISNAQIIGCFLVILGHSYPLGVQFHYSRLDALRTFIYCFHMPFFIFLSGYLTGVMDPTRKYGFYEFIKKRALKLFIPYICLNLIGLLPKLILAGFLRDEVTLTPFFVFVNFFKPREYVWQHLWFLPAVFICYLFSPVIRKALKGKVQALLLVAGSFFLLFLPRTTDFFALEDIRKLLIFFILGMLAGMKLDIEAAGKGIGRFFPVLAVVSAFLFVTLPLTVLTSFIIALLMIMMLMALSVNINLMKLDCFRYLDNKTYAIYLLSWPAQMVIDVLFFTVLQWNFSLCALMMVLAGVIIPVILIEMVSSLSKKYKVGILPVTIGVSK